MASGKKKIAVLLAGKGEANRPVLAGVGRFIANRWDWSVRRSRFHGKPFDLAFWKPDGIIWIAVGPPSGEPIPDLPGHCVTVGSPSAKPRSAAVWCDLESTGSAALEHLCEQGHVHLACLGLRCKPAQQRQGGFVDAAKKKDLETKVHVLPCLDGSFGHHPEQDKAIVAWLKDLPRPLGLFVVCDLLAAHVCEVIRDAGMCIPDDIAIVGAGNDVTAALTARPALTTVDLPLEQMGFRAAELLAEMLLGEPARRFAVRAMHVTARRSSESFAVADDVVRRAMTYIHHNAHLPIGVGDVLVAVPVSRRLLEQRFRQTIGRTVMEEIRRCHVRLAMRLLAESDASMSAVAQQSGLSGGTHLGTLIRRYTGMKPLDYRRQNQT